MGAPVGTADSKDEDREGDGERAAMGEDDDSSVGMLVGTEEGVGDGLPLPIIVPASDGVVVGAED